MMNDPEGAYQLMMLDLEERRAAAGRKRRLHSARRCKNSRLPRLSRLATGLNLVGVLHSILGHHETLRPADCLCAC